MSEVRRRFRNRILEILNRSETPSVFECEVILYQAAKLRDLLLTNSLKQQGSNTIQGGPFRGMRYHDFSDEGTHLPKLVGTYEHQLHDTIEESVSQGYQIIVNIGAADGYYGIGMALRCPGSRILLYETHEERQAQCRRLAEMNNVTDRVEIHGTFAREELDRLDVQGRGLILCDIEGAERDLLDPDKSRSLRHFDMIVECHDLLADPGAVPISELLRKRFDRTHIARLISQDRFPGSPVPVWAQRLSQLDQLMCLWEERAGPTPWLKLTAKPLSNTGTESVSDC